MHVTLGQRFDDTIAAYSPAVMANGGRRQVR